MDNIDSLVVVDYVPTRSLISTKRKEDLLLHHVIRTSLMKQWKCWSFVFPTARLGYKWLIFLIVLARFRPDDRAASSLLNRRGLDITSWTRKFNDWFISDRFLVLLRLPELPPNHPTWWRRKRHAFGIPITVINLENLIDVESIYLLPHTVSHPSAT